MSATKKGPPSDASFSRSLRAGPFETRHANLARLVQYPNDQRQTHYHKGWPHFQPQLLQIIFGSASQFILQPSSFSEGWLKTRVAPKAQIPIMGRWSTLGAGQIHSRGGCDGTITPRIIPTPARAVTSNDAPPFSRATLYSYEKLNTPKAPQLAPFRNKISHPIPVGRQ
jgi:hypothetical protein